MSVACQSLWETATTQTNRHKSHAHPMWRHQQCIFNGRFVSSALVALSTWTGCPHLLRHRGPCCIVFCCVTFVRFFRTLDVNNVKGGWLFVNGISDHKRVDFTGGYRIDSRTYFSWLDSLLMSMSTGLLQRLSQNPLGESWEYSRKDEIGLGNCVQLFGTATCQVAFDASTQEFVERA